MAGPLRPLRGHFPRRRGKKAVVQASIYSSPVITGEVSAKLTEGALFVFKYLSPTQTFKTQTPAVLCF